MSRAVARAAAALGVAVVVLLPASAEAASDHHGQAKKKPGQRHTVSQPSNRPAAPGKARQTPRSHGRQAAPTPVAVRVPVRPAVTPPTTAPVGVAPVQRVAVPVPVARTAAPVRPAPAPVRAAAAAGPTSLAQAISHPRAIAPVLTTNASLPLGMLAAVLLFLAVQGRIDRSDPKLRVTSASSTDELTFSLPRGIPDTDRRPRALPVRLAVSPLTTSTRLTLG